MNGSCYSGHMDSFARPHESLCLPADFVGDFVQPTNANLCCVVMRTGRNKEATPPRRCPVRRQGPRAKGEARPLCCHSHKKHELDAQEWAIGVVTP